MKTHSSRPPSAVLLLALAAACGAPPTSSPLPTMGPPVSDFPTGSFNAASSTWAWNLNADGTYYSSGTISSERGTYSVNGEQITLIGDYCPNVEGTYTWTSDGTLLGFKALDDPCTDRRGIVAGSVWVKQP